MNNKLLIIRSFEVISPRNSVVKVLAISFATVLFVFTGAQGAGGAINRQSASTDLQEVSITLARQPDKPSLYSLVLADADERVISGLFSVEQLEVLRAIMNEADKFAITSESVGAKEPITTRFADKQVQAFIVDVQKTSNLSILFLTIKTETGEMTWTAGRVIPSTRRDEGFFFELLSRLDATLPKQPSKAK